MNKRKVFNISMIFLVIIGLFFGGYSYYRFNQLKKGIDVGNEKEIKNLISKVSRLYLLPTDETPTLATVTDPKLLKDKSFFTLAEMGDKVLIYSNYGKAILYRPSLNKIIEVVPVKINLNKDIENMEIDIKDNVKKDND